MKNMFRHTDIVFRDIPGIRQKFDYDVRTDGQPVYSGYADIEATEGSALGWTIFKFTYVNDQVTMIESRRGSWTGRVALMA